MEDQTTQPQMTEEEMQKASEVYAKEYEEFIKNLKDHPTAVVTAEALTKAMEYIFNDIGGIAQMGQNLSHNMNHLNNNFNQLVQAIQGGGQSGPAVKQTKSGIILP